jgi:hypothetical protein
MSALDSPTLDLPFEQEGTRHVSHPHAGLCD